MARKSKSEKQTVVIYCAKYQGARVLRLVEQHLMGLPGFAFGQMPNLEDNRPVFRFVVSPTFATGEFTRALRDEQSICQCYIKYYVAIEHPSEELTMLQCDAINGARSFEELQFERFILARGLEEDFLAFRKQELDSGIADPDALSKTNDVWWTDVYEQIAAKKEAATGRREEPLTLDQHTKVVALPGAQAGVKNKPNEALNLDMASMTPEERLVMALAMVFTAPDDDKRNEWTTTAMELAKDVPNSGSDRIRDAALAKAAEIELLITPVSRAHPTKKHVR